MREACPGAAATSSDVPAYADLGAFPLELHPGAGQTDDCLDRLVHRNAEQTDVLALDCHLVADASVGPGEDHSNGLVETVHGCRLARGRDFLKAQDGAAVLDAAELKERQRLGEPRLVEALVLAQWDAALQEQNPLVLAQASVEAVAPVGAQMALLPPAQLVVRGERAQVASLVSAQPVLALQR